MESYLYQELEHTERMQLLIKQCIGRETMSFKRTLTPADVADRKDLYAREQMRLATFKKDFADYKARKVADIKAIEKNQEAALEVIANESVEVFDETFLIPNHVENMVFFVDKLGEVVHRREMKPEERQGRLMLPDSETVAIVEGEPGGFEEIEHEMVTNEQGNEESNIEDHFKAHNPENGAIAANKAAKNKGGRKKKTETKKVSDTKTPDKPTPSNFISAADPDAMERIKDM